MEIAIEPIGSDDIHMHQFVANCVAVVKDSGLEYQVGPMSTVVQGDLERLFDVAAKMHRIARRSGDAPRVVTTIRIDDVVAAHEHTLGDRVKLVEKELDLGPAPAGP